MLLFRSLLLFVLLVGGAALAPAQDADYAAVLGYWEGAYMRDGSIQVVKLDLVERDGQLQGLFTIPDLGIYRTPARGGVRFGNGWLRYNFTYGQTVLLLDPEAAELRGEAITQRDSIVSRIQLKRTLRPAPPPIHEEHLTFEVGEVTMAGTLVRPAWRRGLHPAVIFVQGRSYGTRWGQYAETQRLAQRGVAAFIFDGRGRGQSGGDPATATAGDRFADVEAALKLLRSRSDIDATQIGLWGISAGGWISPVVAQRTGQVAFLILDVGPAESLADQQGHVAEYRMRWFAKKDFTEDDYREAFEYQKSLVELSWQDGLWSGIEPLVAHARTQPWANYVDLPENMDNSELDYFRRRKGYDPVPALRQLTIPVLAFYGERDFVVSPQANVPKLERYLQEAGNTDYKIVVFPEGNHGMSIPARTHQGGEWPERAYRWPRMAPGVHETIYGWILNHVRVIPLTP